MTAPCAYCGAYNCARELDDDGRIDCEQRAGSRLDDHGQPRADSSCPNCHAQIAADAMPGIEAVCTGCSVPLRFDPPGQWSPRAWLCWSCSSSHAPGRPVIELDARDGTQAGMIVPGDCDLVLFICARCDREAQATIDGSTGALEA